MDEEKTTERTFSPPVEERADDALSTKSASGRIRRILYPIILLVLPFIFFLPGTRGELMLGDGDAFIQFMPFWEYAAEQWRNWDPPFWTPHIFAGFPLMAEPQAGVFHPNKLLFLLLDPLRAMNLTVLIFYGLAGLFTYLLAREEGLTPEAGLLGGIAFAYCGFLIGHQAITALFITAASFPVIFYVFRLTLRRADYVSVLWGMAAVLFVVLNGHPQFTFYALFFAGFYAVYLLFFVLKARVERVAYAKRVIVIYLLGAGLAAFQLLPTLELVLRSMRDELTYGNFVDISLPPQTLLTSLISTKLYHIFPNEGSEAMLDVGLWVLLLAILGVWMARRVAAFWVFLFGFSALLFIGDYTPLYKLMYWVPGYNLFRVASRNGIAVDFAVAMLAAWGIYAVQIRPSIRRWGLAVLAVIPLIYYWTLYKPDRKIFDQLFKAAANKGVPTLSWSLETVREALLPLFPQMLLMCAGALLVLFLLKRFAGGLLIAIVAICLAVSHFWGYRTWIFTAPAAEVEASLRPQPLLESLPKHPDGLPSRAVFGGASAWMDFLGKDPDGWRKAYVGIGGVDVNMLHRVNSISGYTPLIERDFARLAGDMQMWGGISDPRFFSSTALDLLNVEYVVVNNDELSYPPEVFNRLELWKKDAKTTVYRNPRAPGFFWPVTTVTKASEEEFWHQMAEPSVDFSKTALLIDGDAGLTSKSFGNVSRLRGGLGGPNRIVLEVEAPASAFLASSHSFYPGWRASIDGKRADIQRINGIFCGIAVPAGSHRIVFRFVPLSFWIGLLISGLSLLLFGVLSKLDLLRLNALPRSSRPTFAAIMAASPAPGFDIRKVRLPVEFNLEMIRQKKDVLKRVLLAVVVSLFVLYYGLIAWHSDVGFDGAIFSQSVVSLVRYGVPSNAYNIVEPSDLHLALTNLSQGMFSQYILGWPFIKLFGVNNVTLQINNLIFLIVSPLVLYLLVRRISGNFYLGLFAVVLFFTFPRIELLGLRAFGEIPAFGYSVLTALILHKALRDHRYYPLLGLAAFLAFHTKHFLVLYFPMLLLVLGYLWIFQRQVRLKDILLFSVTFLAPTVTMHLFFLFRYGWAELMKEYALIHDMVTTGQWGPAAKPTPFTWSQVTEAIGTIRNEWGTARDFYVPLFVGYALGFWVVLRNFRRKPFGLHLDREQAVILFLLGASFFYNIYWYHFSVRLIWYRKLMPLMMLNIPLYIMVLKYLFDHVREKRPILYVASTLVFFPLIFAHTSQFIQLFEIKTHDEPWLQNCKAAVRVVKTLPQDKRLFGMAWWQAPRIGLYADRLILNINTPAAEKYKEGYLVFDHEALGISPQEVTDVLNRYDTKLIYSNPHYQIHYWKARELRDDSQGLQLSSALQILEVGPRELRVGELVYPQPNGNSAIWVRAANATPSTVIVWGDKVLKTDFGGAELLTAQVPKEFYPAPGTIEVWLADFQARVKSNIFKVIVHDAQPAKQ